MQTHSYHCQENEMNKVKDVLGKDKIERCIKLSATASRNRTSRRVKEKAAETKTMVHARRSS